MPVSRTERRRRSHRAVGVIGVLALWLAAGTLVAQSGTTYPGFRIGDPPGEGWRQVQRNAATIVWMKRLHDPRGSFSAAVLTGPAPTRFEDREAFAAYVRRSKTANPDPRRFALTLERFEGAASPAEGCVRYRTALIDRQTAAGGRQPLVLRITGLACLHPERPERYFDIQYAARAPRGIEPGDDEIAEGEAFLEGFEFGPPPEDDRWALGEGEARPQRREQT